LFSLNWIRGIGQIDGEIVETLWWPIDKVANITRAMTKAHRREVLDDVMYDSNWKKWIGIGKFYVYVIQFIDLRDLLVSSLVRKYRNAVQGFAETKLPFDQLTKILDSEWVKEWRIAEEKALSQRGDHMRIYDVNTASGIFLFQPIKISKSQKMLILSGLAPTQAEKRLTLQKEEIRSNIRGRSVAWLCQGLSIEESQ
jgi:Kyakuja-Dileera-Zisupton transposase